MALGTLTAAGLFAYWIHKNEGRLRATSTAATQAGEAYGRDHDAEQCLAFAVDRLCTGLGFADEILNQARLEACLGTAVPVQRMCVGVPPQSEILASVGWARDFAAAHPAADEQALQRLLRVVQKHCADPKPPR